MVGSPHQQYEIRVSRSATLVSMHSVLAKPNIVQSLDNGKLSGVRADVENQVIVLMPP